MKENTVKFIEKIDMLQLFMNLDESARISSWHGSRYKSSDPSVFIVALKRRDVLIIYKDEHDLIIDGHCSLHPINEWCNPCFESACPWVKTWDGLFEEIIKNRFEHSFEFKYICDAKYVPAMEQLTTILEEKMKNMMK